MERRYLLCRHALGRKGEVEISESEYLDLATAIAKLVEVSDLEEKFNVFIDNYSELERGLLEEALQAMIYAERRSVGFFVAKSNISRRVVNLLTAIRLYLDTLPQHANRLLEGEALAKLKAAPSRAFDRSASYRVMEALRNYAQHFALPVHGWEVGRSWDDPAEPNLQNVWVNPSLDVKALARWDDFKKATLEELKQKAEPVLLKPLIREYIEELAVVHSEFRAATQQLQSDAMELINSAAKRFLDAFPGSLVSVVALPVDECGIKQGKPVHLSAVVMDYLPHLQDRIDSLVNLSRRRLVY